MKADELRIGNYLKGLQGDILEIEQIKKDCDNYIGYAVYFSNKDSSSLIHDLELQPIPLTEEWLLKFGFEFFKHHYLGYDIFKKDNLLIAMMIVNVIFIDDYDTALAEIKHVHQLQNLYFALTGEELILKK